MIPVGVWVPWRAAGPLGPPVDLPLGRAALILAGEGIDVILGGPVPHGGFVGVRADGEAWAEARVDDVQAVFDRFPSASRPADFAEGLERLGERPVGNAPALSATCRDKVATQRILEAAGLEVPPCVDAPEAFDAALADWGVAFLKPAEGSFGEGIVRVEAGDPLPADGDWLLQRAVPPPRGWAGIALRVLVQRQPDHTWVARPPVARRHRQDPVVNAARGAEVVPAEDVDGLDRDRVAEVAAACARALAEACGEPALEVGVDLVLDADLRPWPVEVNGRPRGRLRALAARWPERFAAAHDEAVVTPLRTLARWPR